MRRLLMLTAATLLLTAGTAQAAEPSRFVGASGRFDTYRPGAVATTYKPDLVPVGSRASVLAVSSQATGLRTKLIVHGLRPDREYGAHVHTKPCGATGDAAGPHFQHRVDPKQPSVDPAYANPRNEVWLDFTTNRLGSAVAKSTVDWRFGERRAGSVVIHEHHTHTDPGHAGTAGSRLACLTVNF
ncbi:superoxide dismutase family protein [Amycolatopsis suaedae]|uniref:Superoxide dismutase n=1 Tax=Amycolatopsis suaedae TaxID=2510978 RepID=A0A4Q7JD87_9PSEU|nr:superoxide dismutase family protein [Amycolatopsis suaedae]RZQ65349.1 superoxide dismutase [Amycolatopsis suaedae]